MGNGISKEEVEKYVKTTKCKWFDPFPIAPLHTHSLTLRIKITLSLIVSENEVKELLKEFHRVAGPHKSITREEFIRVRLENGCHLLQNFAKIYK
jgi:hypothetical protein